MPQYSFQIYDSDRLITQTERYDLDETEAHIVAIAALSSLFEKTQITDVPCLYTATVLDEVDRAVVRASLNLTIERLS